MMSRPLCVSTCIRADVWGRAAAAFRIGAAVVACASPAGAHGFGERYELPLPLSFYLFGTVAAVFFSFVIVGLFVRHAPPVAYPRVGRLSAVPGLVSALKIIALLLFFVAIAAGFGGSQNPYRNIGPTLVWIIFWVGLAYISAFVGNVWALINPWQTLFDWADRAYRRLRGRDLSLGLQYPEALGVWPAFLLLFAFAWVELIYPNSAVPAHIACLALFYSALTWAGMFVFGSIWLRHGELFSVVFGLLARFAPTEAISQRDLALRPFGAGLLDSQPVSTSMVAFVLLLLTSVIYDGLLTGPEWAAVERALSTLVPGGSLAIRTAGLAVVWLLFIGTYAAISVVMSVFARQRSALDLARNFALTLVPIAIGYHVAHYLVFLLIQGQYIIPLLSDPFGYGWNLFGTAGYRIDIGIVGARFAWYTAVIAIVLGHIAAVYLAHVKAIRIFTTRGAALRSQVPLTALMMLYTFVSLSILSEPIVEQRAPAQASTTSASIRVPEEAVLPVAGDGRLQNVEPGRLAAQKLTYRVLGSAFHDGTRMDAADLLYAIMFAYRWGVRGEAGDARYDPLVDAATAPMRQHLVGLRLIGTDAASRTFRIGDVDFLREILVVEVYTTVSPDNLEQDAAVTPPWSTLPWHLIVLIEEAVGRNWAAFSQAEAFRRGVEWLDLVRSEAMNKRLYMLVEKFQQEGFRPQSLQSLVSSDDARKRWAALDAFYKKNGHFLVTNGPYQLKRWSTDIVVLEAFRDLSYPLGVGSYDAYAVPRRGFVTNIERQSGAIKIFAEIETISKFQRSYRLVRQPLQAIAADVRKRAAPECRYVVVDAENRIVLSGVAPLADDATFRVELDSKLPAGRYTISALIAVNGNVMNADIQRVQVDIAGN
jgi:hypothetical protein